MTNKKIQDFLLTLDLTKHEALIYEGLLKMKEGSVKEISEYLGLNRITTHDSVESLLEKGLVSAKQVGPRRRIIMATSLDRLEYLLEKKEEKIRLLRKGLPKVIEEMRIFQSSNPHKIFNVRFYEGRIGVMQVYKEVLKADLVYSFADLEKYYEVFPNTSDMWIDALNRNPKRKMWDLLVDSPTSRKIADQHYERYFSKILPDPHLFNGIAFADYLIYNNKIAIVKLDSENPVATVIESEDVTASLQALHQTMWSIIPGK